jgi:hypothetical protein
MDQIAKQSGIFTHGRSDEISAFWQLPRSRAPFVTTKALELSSYCVFDRIHTVIKHTDEEQVAGNKQGRHGMWPCQYTSVRPPSRGQDTDA